ncbi:MAG: hypothetical protein GWN00_19495, partial [Aliifodinibius sp.]|nr:hypothetical protein [Fodinibius sp.]NIW98058.1 hypothetical protein [Phycisphaerae bacterium]NIY26909.1 hypothetical protein [Fodinibius sp.]
YLSRVLALDPDYPPALKLQEQLTDHFFNKGSAALSKDNLTRAIYYYKAILAMKPGDPLLLDKINQTLQKKSVTVLLHSFGEIAKTRQQIEQIRTERLRLQEMLATEGQKISDLARQSKGIQQLPTKKTEPRTTRPKAPIQQTVSNEQTSKTKVQTASIGSSFQESLGIELLPPSEKEDTETKIVEEALIDGGAKKVTHREKPEITPELKESDEFVMILAECTVGKDGTVEKVNLLSGARDKKLNQLATTAFQKYRYQPATYNGEPVRFKTIEVMSF